MSRIDRYDAEGEDLPPLDISITNPLRYVASGPAATRGPACLPDETIAALAEGVLDEQARAAALPHLASCAWCRGAVASVSSAMRDPELAREIAAPGRPRRRWVTFGLPAAAAAAIVLVVLQRTPAVDRGEHRAPPTGTAPAPAGPAGFVARPRVIAWPPVAGADRYRLVLFDATGRVVYETQGVDTSVMLPDSVTLVAGRRYAWKVDARLGLNRWSASSLREFTVEDGRP